MNNALVDKKALDIAIDKLWSNHCDLDFWVIEMTSGKPQNIPKWVLKMAMKHLRDDMYNLHSWACVIKEEMNE